MSHRTCELLVDLLQRCPGRLGASQLHHVLHHSSEVAGKRTRTFVRLLVVAQFGVVRAALGKL